MCILILGENVKIICAAQGFPAPEIQFRRNQHRLRKVTENFPWILKRSMVYVGKKALARSEGIMIIKNVNKRDFGDISCRVQNAAGREDVTVRLGIHKRPVEPCEYLDGLFVLAPAKFRLHSCFPA